MLSARFLIYGLHQNGMHFKYQVSDHIVAQNLFEFQKNQIYKHKGKQETVSSLIIGANKHVWLHELRNKLSQLYQGNNHGVQYTDTTNLIFRSEVPNDRSITYASFVCNYKPLKIKPYCVRCVYGGEKSTI